MATSKIKVKIEFNLNAWQRSGLIAGCMWRAAIGRDYKQWLAEQVVKHIKVSEPYANG